MDFDEEVEKQIKKLFDLLNMIEIQNLDISILDSCFQGKINRNVWNYVSMIQNLPIPFLKKYKKWLNWEEVSIYHKFNNLNELIEVEDYINWSIFPQNLSLTEEMIRVYQDQLNWHVIVMQNELQNRDIDFIRQYEKKIDFSLWIRNKKVEENIIKEFKKKWTSVDWGYITKYHMPNHEFTQKYLSESLQDPFNTQPPEGC